MTAQDVDVRALPLAPPARPQRRLLDSIKHIAFWQSSKAPSSQASSRASVSSGAKLPRVT